MDTKWVSGVEETMLMNMSYNLDTELDILQLLFY